jgi:hypothetical protein
VDQAGEDCRESVLIDVCVGLYADYWCWSGTNSKGRTGVFPQSHIDLQTLRGQDSTVIKKSRGRSFFGMWSHSSTETAKGGSGHRNSIAG